MYRGWRVSVWLLVLVSTVAALACASTPSGGPSGAAGPAANEPCFNVRKVDSISPLHARFVYVRLLGGEQYLLTLDSFYLNLPSAVGFRIFSGVTWVCSDSGAGLAFRDAGNRVSARIIRVEAVASREAAMQAVKDRSAQDH